jgi:hypothetical protein
MVTIQVLRRGRCALPSASLSPKEIRSNGALGGKRRFALESFETESESQCVTPLPVEGVAW